MLCSRGSSQSRNQTQVSRIAGGFFTISATREAHASETQVSRIAGGFFTISATREAHASEPLPLH